MKDPNWFKCVLNADSKDIIRHIPDNSIDLILTDPPYNIGKYSTGNIPLPGRSAMNNDIAQWDLIEFNPEEWAEEFIRILKPTGNLFIFTSYNQIGLWHKCLDHKFDTTNFMICHKTNPAPKIFKAGFLNSCKMIFTCWNKKHTWIFTTQAEMHNFIESPICMRPERLSNPKHPAQKPVKILKKIIEIASNPGDIVFDPFMGVGSVGVAAMETGRRFIGIEIDHDYCNAGKNRIDQSYIEMIKEQHQMDEKEKTEATVSEPAVAYETSLFELNDFFQDNENTQIDTDSIGRDHIVLPSLSPIIKWPGGKEKELKYIIENLPTFERYIEPFVGGGSVFMALNSEKYLINDRSEELISLYRLISSGDADYFRYSYDIEASWQKSYQFFNENTDVIDLFIRYRQDQISQNELRQYIKDFCNLHSDKISDIISDFDYHKNIFHKEVEANLYRKMVRMRQLELQKHILPEQDLRDNIETAFKSALYMYFRYLYNSKDIQQNTALHTAIFMFIRNYAYSGMFRYSSKGDFNVPYGGIGYNSKSLIKKLGYYKSAALLHKFGRTKIYNLDFEDFLNEVQPTERDFIFLDPPYDTEFSTYAKNSFTRDDQKRLANYLIDKCKAKWMLIIKNTDFIFSLYNRPCINIRSFEKNYTVSFMNRNDKKVTHLIITNY